MNALYLTHLHAGATPPHGVTSTGGALLVALATAGVLLVPSALVLLAWLHGRRGGTDDEDGSSGSGGGGSRPSGPDGPRDPDGEPVWWPEFERQFAEWVERVQAGRPAPAMTEPVIVRQARVGLLAVSAAGRATTRG